MSGDISDELVARSVWTDDDLVEHGIPVTDVAFVTIGGGVGSFAMVNTLRIAGLAPEAIRVLGDGQSPTRTYEYLATNSQIEPEHRLRSDSGSVMDCIWGWPGYALRESWARKDPAPAAQVLVEPILADYYTPQAGRVYASVTREAARIGWTSMLTTGVVRHIRRRDRGDWFVVLTPPAGQSATKRVAYRCRYVHLAVGYPGVRFLPDLQAYRNTYGDYQRVVNAYEPHDHVYEEMRRRPCTVIVRGAGIVASRVLQRLIDDRDRHGAGTRIVHLFRTYPFEDQGDRATFRRKVRNGWAYQAFNFPKASWGGQLRTQLEGLEGDARRDFIDQIGGTNTAPRKRWKHQLDRGFAEGFYAQAHGEVHEVTKPAGAEWVRTSVDTSDGRRLSFDADFIIDATGLEASIDDHRLLVDVLDHVGADRNVKGRLDVERDFRVRGTDNGAGRMYASGSITLGGYYAGVDSFLGLQYAALRIQDALAAEGFGRRIGPLRSTTQWFRWARGVAP